MKWIMPSFMVSIVTMIALALNKKFIWNLDPTQLVASITLSVNFVGVSIIKDIMLMKNGGKPTWNSTKLVTLFVALVIIGFSEYVGIELSDEDVWLIAGTCATFLTTKGIKDIIQTKQNGGTTNGDTQPATFIENNK